MFGCQPERGVASIPEAVSQEGRDLIRILDTELEMWPDETNL